MMVFWQQLVNHCHGCNKLSVELKTGKYKDGLFSIFNDATGTRIAISVPASVPFRHFLA